MITNLLGKKKVDFVETELLESVDLELVSSIFKTICEEKHYFNISLPQSCQIGMATIKDYDAKEKCYRLSDISPEVCRNKINSKGDFLISFSNNGVTVVFYAKASRVVQEGGEQYPIIRYPKDIYCHSARAEQRHTVEEIESTSIILNINEQKIIGYIKNYSKHGLGILIPKEESFYILQANKDYKVDQIEIDQQIYNSAHFKLAYQKQEHEFCMLGGQVMFNDSDEQRRYWKDLKLKVNFDDVDLD